MDQVSVFLAALLQSVAQSAPYVVIGYLIAAVLREYVPVSTMARLFAPQGIRPLLTATGIGAMLPMCSCMVIPLGVGLVRSGAAPGTVLSFLVTAPALSPVAVILSLTLMGLTFTTVYVLTVLLGALLLGLIGNRALRGLTAPASPTCADEPLQGGP